MRSGRLNKRVDVQTKDATRDSHNADVYVWRTICSPRAAITPQSGQEFTQADKTHAQTSHMIEMRWFDGLTNDMRIVYGTRIFNIVKLLNWREIDRKWLVTCEEVI